MHRVKKEIASSGNRVRYTMNVFIISVGGYVKALSAEAIKIGKSIGHLTIDSTAQPAKYRMLPAIQKMISKGYKKKKMARC